MVAPFHVIVPLRMIAHNLWAPCIMEIFCLNETWCKHETWAGTSPAYVYNNLMPTIDRKLNAAPQGDKGWIDPWLDEEKLLPGQV